MAETKTHEYHVTMTCEGCSGAVQRVLNKYQDKGVDNVDISIPDQKVKVTTTLTPNEVLDIIKKTGKNVEYTSTY